MVISTIFGWNKIISIMISNKICFSHNNVHLNNIIPAFSILIHHWMYAVYAWRLYCRNPSSLTLYILLFAELRLHREKIIQFQTSSSLQNSQALVKHKTHTGSAWCHVHLHTHSEMGKQSPVTLKQVTLNYLNDQTESEKEGRRAEMELQRFLNVPEARKDHLLKHFSLAYPNTDTYTHHQCLLYFGHFGCRRRRNCVWPNVGSSASRRHILRCYLHERRDYVC